MTGDDWDDDPEYDVDDDDDSSTIDCPACGRAVYDDSVQCPHCGHFIEDDELEPSTPRWWRLLVRIMVIVLLVIFVGPAVAMLILLLG